MHQYRHHIGDFRKDTGHLPDLEELAYRRMIELYYDTESPLPADVAWIARRVKSTPEIVQRVLDDFFQSTDAGWRQSRCDEEIADYRKAVRLARTNGKRGGRPRKPTATEPEPDGNRVGSHPDTAPGPSGGAGRKLPIPRTPVPVPLTPVPLRPSGPEKERTSSLSATATKQDDRPRESGPEGGGGTPEGRAALFRALRGSTYRENSQHREHDLTQATDRLHNAGVTAKDLTNLAHRAARKGDKPSGLFSHWIDHLDELLKELSKR